MKKLIKFFILNLFLISPLLNASFFGNLKNRATSLVKDGLSAYNIAFAGILVHELGHAITAYHYYKNPVDITIGTKDRSPLIKLPGLAVTSLNPLLGGGASATLNNTTLTHMDNAQNRLKNMVITAAGPLAGLTFYTGLLLKLNHTFPGKYNHFLSKLACYKGVAHELFNMLPIQIDDGSNHLIIDTDGARFAQELERYRSGR